MLLHPFTRQIKLLSAHERSQQNENRQDSYNRQKFNKCRKCIRNVVYQPALKVSHVSLRSLGSAGLCLSKSHEATITRPASPPNNGTHQVNPSGPIIMPSNASSKSVLNSAVRTQPNI